MQSGEPKPTFSDTKKLVRKLDDILEYEFAEPEQQEKQFREFFYFKEGEIKDGELHDFIILYKHLLKRVILSLKANDDKLYQQLDSYHTSIELFLRHGHYGQRTLRDIATLEISPHDVSHALANIINGRFEEENKLTPLFTEEAVGERTVNKQMMEDELYSSLFAFKNMAISIETQRDAETLEEYIETYTTRVMSLTLGSIQSDILALPGIQRKDKDKYMELAQNISLQIEKDPPQKILEILKYLWSNRDNPRILVDLFFKEIGSYIEELKKRTPRDIYKNKYDLKPKDDQTTDTQKD